MRSRVLLPFRERVRRPHLYRARGSPGGRSVRQRPRNDDRNLCIEPFRHLFVLAPIQAAQSRDLRLAGVLGRRDQGRVSGDFELLAAMSAIALATRRSENTREVMSCVSTTIGSEVRRTAAARCRVPGGLDPGVPSAVPSPEGETRVAQARRTPAVHRRPGCEGAAVSVFP